MKTDSIPIKAAVLRKMGCPLRIEDLQMDAPRSTEILVKIMAAGICHTDISFCDDWVDKPVVLGHEGAGIVDHVGKDVKGFRKGDHVVLSYQSCGHCRSCKSGRPARCLHFNDLNFGFMRPDGTNPLSQSGVLGSFFGQSAFANYVLATERNCVKVPRKYRIEELAPLGCGLQTGAGTVMNSLKIAAGQSVAIFGTGAVGLAAIMSAKIAGAEPIIAVDKIVSRLRLAHELGATHMINTGKEGDLAARVFDAAANGVNYVLETTGIPDMLEMATEILKKGGIVANIAIPNGKKKLSGGRKIIDIIQGDAVPQSFIPHLIELYRRGRFPFDRLLRFYEFHEINKAISDSRRGAAIKPVLLIRH
jgi:aryl-alcohol dehydrogenase